MTAFAMQSGSSNFGGDFLQSLQRFALRVAAAIAILFLLAVLALLLIPMAIIGIGYALFRSVFPGRARADNLEHPPIPSSDDEGRENVRVRRNDEPG